MISIILWPLGHIIRNADLTKSPLQKFLLLTYTIQSAYTHTHTQADLLCTYCSSRLKKKFFIYTFVYPYKWKWGNICRTNLISLFPNISSCLLLKAPIACSPFPPPSPLTWHFARCCHQLHMGAGLTLPNRGLSWAWPSALPCFVWSQARYYLLPCLAWGLARLSDTICLASCRTYSRYSCLYSPIQGLARWAPVYGSPNAGVGQVPVLALPWVVWSRHCHFPLSPLIQGRVGWVLSSSGWLGTLSPPALA